MRISTVILAALACASLAIRPARAQTAADTAALARATAAILADSVLPQIRETVVWQHFDNPFDDAVAENLRGYDRLARRAADPEHAVHVGVRSLTIMADTARVLVETWQRYKDTGPLTTWIQGTEYVFRQTSDGWRFDYMRVVDNADAGPVRGR